MNGRQKILMDKLARFGRVSFEEEAVFHGVTTMTIRRDIALLESMGLAVKAHGGALARISKSGQLFGEDCSTEAQKKIAVQAIGYIPEGCTLMLSGGTTTLEVARQLAVSGKRLTVLSNSLSIAAVLFQTQVQVILTGGMLRQSSLDLIGPVAEKNIDEYYIDILISGCDGAIAGEGFFTKDLNLAVMEKKSVEKSHKVIIVAESTKFAKPSFVKFASPSDVSIVITDSAMEKKYCETLQKQGCNVVCC